MQEYKKTRRPGNRPTDEELMGAALQYVRKVNGCRERSRVHEGAFTRAVEEIKQSTRILQNDLIVRLGQSTHLT